MNDDAQAQEIQGTVVSSGRFAEPTGDRMEPSEAADRDEDLDPEDEDLDPEDEDLDPEDEDLDPEDEDLDPVDEDLDPVDEEDDDEERDHAAGPIGSAPAGRGTDDEVIDPDAVIIVESQERAGDEERAESGQPAGDEAPATTPVAGFARSPVAPSASATAGEAASAQADAAPGGDSVPEADVIAEAAGVSEAGAASGAAVPETSAVHEANAVPGTSAVPEHDVMAEAARPGVPGQAGLPVTGGLAGDPEQMHQRWSAIQSAFVDDPRASVADAAEFVSEAIAALVAGVQERERGLRAEWERDGADTEDLRNALRGYRGLLNQLTAS